MQLRRGKGSRKAPIESSTNAPSSTPPPERDPAGGWTTATTGLVAVYAALAGVQVTHLARGLLAPNGVASTDFTVFWTGWWLIAHGQGSRLYEEGAQRIAQHTVVPAASFEGGLMAFLNPPHAALAGLPFGWLADRAGEPASFALWSALNAVLLLQLDRRLAETVGAPAGRARWLVTATLLAFFPVLYALSIGQLSLLLAVAALELPRALERDHAGRAAAWFLVFTVKPQLTPPLALFLAVRGHWRVLARAGAFAIPIVVSTALILGRDIWVDYLRSVHGLEHFFGTGTPVYMMNVRGQLTRWFGATRSAGTIYAATIATWLTAMAALGVGLAARHRRGTEELRRDFALTLAVGLLTSPHLFAQDATLWVVPLALHLAALRGAGGGRAWQSFARFVMAWPLLFELTRILDLAAGDGPSLRVDPIFVAMLIATLALCRSGLRPRRTLRGG